MRDRNPVSRRLHHGRRVFTLLVVSCALLLGTACQRYTSEPTPPEPDINRTRTSTTLRPELTTTLPPETSLQLPELPSVPEPPTTAEVTTTAPTTAAPTTTAATTEATTTTAPTTAAPTTTEATTEATTTTVATAAVPPETTGATTPVAPETTLESATTPASEMETLPPETAASDGTEAPDTGEAADENESTGDPGDVEETTEASAIDSEAAGSPDTDTPAGDDLPEEVRLWLSLDSLPAGLVAPEQVTPNAYEQFGDRTAATPYWTGIEDDVKRHMAELVAAALDARALEVELAPALTGVTIDPADQEQFDTDLNTIVFSVKDANPRYFMYSNWITPLYYYRDTEGMRSFDSYTVSFEFLDAYDTAEKQANEWARIDEHIRLIGDRIMAQTANDWERLVLLHDYLTRISVYSPTADRNHNNIASCYFAGESMCVGYSLGFESIADYMGFDTITIYGYAGGETHNWNKVLLDGSWYNVDVTWDDPQPDRGTEAQPLHVNFLRSDEAMASSHEIYSPGVPASPNDYLAAYEANDAVVTTREEMVNRIALWFDAFVPDDGQRYALVLYAVGYDPDMATIAEILSDAWTMWPREHVVSWFYQIDKGIITLELQSS